MKVLFLGDIVGKKGREVVRDFLPLLKDRFKPDFIVVNGENSAHGKGITLKIYDEFLSWGIDCITMGNHTFSKKDIIEHLEEMDKMVCPANHIDKLGHGYRIFNVNNKKICVINILGTVMQETYTSSPYLAMDDILRKTKNENIDIYFVDMHAEATAEKRLFVEYYKNKVNAVVGTHTHVQTADEQVIDSVGYITDVGMCGPFNSIIGRDIDECIDKMIFNQATKYTISEEEAILCGVFLEFDDLNNRCINIERIQIRP